MKKLDRILILSSIFCLILTYALVFSIRSPFKDLFYPLIYRQSARDIEPRQRKKRDYTHIFILKSGKNINANILSEDQMSYLLQEHGGNRGVTASEQRIKKSDILELQEVNKNIFPVTGNEIAIKRMFPKFNVFRKENYTIFTDGNYAYIGTVMLTLEKVYRQINQRFIDIGLDNQKKRRVVVVVFQKESEYRDYVSQINPSFANTVGFYHDDYETLFVCNDTSLRRSMRDPNAIIRHEGAHQIFYTTGLHFGFNVDRLWLVEGLAVYSEPLDLGNVLPFRQLKIKKVMRSKNYIPLSKLVERSWSFNQAKDNSLESFYDQSWAFVYFLMKRYEKEFKLFLKEVKDHPLRSLLKGDQPLLEKHLNRTFVDLEKEYKAFWMNK